MHLPQTALCHSPCFPLGPTHLPPDCPLPRPPLLPSLGVHKLHQVAPALFHIAVGSPLSLPPSPPPPRSPGMHQLVTNASWTVKRWLLSSAAWLSGDVGSGSLWSGHTSRPHRESGMYALRLGRGSSQVTHAAPMLHPCCTRAAPVLHPCCTPAAPVLHPCCTRASPVLHPCCTHDSHLCPVYQVDRTPSARRCVFIDGGLPPSDIPKTSECLNALWEELCCKLHAMCVRHVH